MAGAGRARPPVLAVVDYGIGNLRSAEKALQRVGADASLVDDPSAIAAADGVVLPGVGGFGRCMDALRSRGLDAAVFDAVGSGRPFLGICVGMQMLYEESEEAPGVSGLGVLEGAVRRLPAGVKHPQMQWNTLEVCRPTGLLTGLDDPEAPAWVYFVHSYAPERTDATVAVCDYGGTVVAAAEKGAVWATQFHPEKSGPAGLRLLGNFVGACRDRQE